MLDNLKHSAMKILNNKTHMLIIMCVLIFILAAIYTYRTHLMSLMASNKYVDNKEFSIGEQNGSADLYFFYTEWCPHCKTAKPVWNSFKEQIGNKKIKNISINFIEVDCDKDTATASQFNVEGYPTIKMVYNDKIIEYDAKPDIDTLHQFLNTSL